MKKLLILMLVLLIPIVMGLEECPRFVEPSKVPCMITSSWVPIDGCNKSNSIYNETGDLIQVRNWSSTTPFCNVTWNISTEGSYVYNSTIEVGQITVKVDDMILASIIGLGIAALFFLFLGYKLDETHNLLRILFTIVGIILISLIPVVLITHDVSVIFHTLLTRLQVVFWLYISVYIVWRVWQKYTVVS